MWAHTPLFSPSGKEERQAFESISCIDEKVKEC